MQNQLKVMTVAELEAEATKQRNHPKRLELITEELERRRGRE